MQKVKRIIKAEAIRLQRLYRFRAGLKRAAKRFPEYKASDFPNAKPGELLSCLRKADLAGMDLIEC